MKKTTPPSRRAASPTAVTIGRAASTFGLFLLPTLLGAVAGFWLADRGWTWFPQMLQAVLLTSVVALVAMAFGRWLAGAAVADSPQGITLRRRVAAMLILALLGTGAWYAINLARDQTPLTSLAPQQFARAFRIDALRYQDHQRGMEGLLLHLQHAGILARPSNEPLGPGQEQLLRETWHAMRNYAISLDQLRAYWEDWWRFDISRAERSYHLRAYLLTYAAELALHEKALRFTHLVQHNENAVKFLDTPSPDHGLPAGSFSLMRQELLGTRDQSRVLAGKQYLQLLATGFRARDEAEALGVSWLWHSAEEHLAAIEALSPLRRGLDTLRADSQALKRRLRRVWFPAQKEFAEWSGDTRVRRIGWYLIDQELQRTFQKRLEPGDIMLSRKNWYLSNIGLPGFWPHAILHIGPPEQLRSYFDDPAVRAWVAEQAGEPMDLPSWLQQRWPARWGRYLAGDSTVIEAISEGVVLNTMAHAAGDYLAAVRPRLSKVAKARAVVEAFAALGKPYDFDFDFATDHALVCTELVWRAYRPGPGTQGLRLPVTRVAGRSTLPANLIAELFATERGSAAAQLDFVGFIDATEKTRKAFFAGETAFVASASRPQWDIVQR